MAEQIAPQALRVLLVEDEKGIRDCLRQFLAMKGYEVGYAESGEAAAKLLSEGFDLLLSDLTLGGMDGYELARRFREANPFGKVILLTGWQIPDERRGSVDLVLIKPMRLHMLAEALELVMGGVAARRAS